MDRALFGANGGEGLEEIGGSALSECRSLHEISIPPAVKVIKYKTFYHWLQLAMVNLGEGLEVIWKKAFGRCISIQWSSPPL